jgi:DHA2 family multidrug resistance protein-like MFS transporter
MSQSVAGPASEASAGGSVGVLVGGPRRAGALLNNHVTDASVYSSLPANAQTIASQSVTGAVAVGHRVGGSAGQQLIHAAGPGFTDGLHAGVSVAAAISIVGIGLAAILILRRAEVGFAIRGAWCAKWRRSRPPVGTGRRRFVV